MDYYLSFQYRIVLGENGGKISWEENAFPLKTDPFLFFKF